MSQLIGKHVEEAKKVLTAAMLSGQNVMLIGKQGTGKTSIAASFAEIMTGEKWIEPQPGKKITENHRGVFIEVSDNTPPEVITGIWAPGQMIKNDKMVRVVEHTPFHPDVAITIMDEFGRGNQAFLNEALHVLNRVTDGVTPPVVATANFVPTDEKNAAMRDRFAYYWHAPDPALDIAALAEAHLSGTSRKPEINPAGIPSLTEIQAVRKMQPTARARAAVASVIQSITNEAEAAGYDINLRTKTQWLYHLAFYSMFLTGSDDFTAVPEEATALLGHCYEALTAQEAADWKALITSVTDAVGASIEAASIQIRGFFHKLADSAPVARVELVPEASKLIQDNIKALIHIGGDDPRIEDTRNTWKKWLAQAMQGSKV